MDYVGAEYDAHTRTVQTKHTHAALTPLFVTVALVLVIRITIPLTTHLRNETRNYF